MSAAAKRSIPVALFVLVLACFGLAGCKSRGDRYELNQAPDKLYQDAAQSLRSGNYKGAIEKLELLESRFPFSNAARQGQLDLMYAYFKNGEGESAIDQADQFIRENPTHPRVDYAYYLKGLVYFESGATWFERAFNVNIGNRPPHEAQKSLQVFQTLLQQYPRSPYGADARQRMIYLRNRLADYDLAVARYYMKRGAYVGAVNRARDVVETYDGSPAAIEALGIMSAGYRKLGIDDLAKIADNVRQVNAPALDPNEGKVKDQPWWHFWN
jgi:outer membrane protein assembly factor BamD